MAFTSVFVKRGLKQMQRSYSLIFLHGLGDTGAGWADTLNNIGLKNVKVICPTAPIQPVTVNMGMKMPSWFDIVTLDRSSDKQDVEGIKASSATLEDLIKKEMESIPSENIFIGGFSQGGAVAIYTALTLDKPIAGLIGLSTWFPIPDSISKSLNINKENLKNIPVFHAHGTLDPMIELKYGLQTRDGLKQYFSRYQFKAYEGMGHSGCIEEMEDIRAFIENVTKKSNL